MAERATTTTTLCEECGWRKKGLSNAIEDSSSFEDFRFRLTEIRTVNDNTSFSASPLKGLFINYVGI